MIIASIYPENGFYAHGDTVLKAEHMRSRMDARELEDNRDITFKLDKNIELVEEGFFLTLPCIKKLIVLNSECNIVMNDETVELFHKNNVLICGFFDSTAESMAKEYGFRFMHTDIMLAAGGDFYSGSGCEWITLCFSENGNACILETCNSQTFGGELRFDLPEEFYLREADSIAKEYAKKYREEIINNDAFITMLKKAKEKGGWLLDYTKN